jgi:hypothetical protein
VTCHDARELFSALIDDTLTREERADVYGHLATCADCRRELAAVEHTVALIRGAAPARAPAGFVDRVVAAARPAPWYVRAARGALLPWPVKLPLGVAALLLVGGLAVLMFRGMQAQQRAARYEPTPPGLTDRAVPVEPAAPPTPGREEAASTDRAASPREANRTAETPTPRSDAVPTPAESARRDAPPAETFSGARAPAVAPPAPDERREKSAAAKLEAPRAMSTPAAPVAPPDVVARLVAPERETAARALAALATRLDGTQTGRRTVGDALVVELAIPRERYADFTREAARLGDYRTESGPAALPDPVRVAVRLGT